MAKSRSLSLVEASASKCGEISTIKCVLLGLLGADRSFSLSTMRRASVSIRLSCKAVTWALKSPGLGLIPQEISQHPVRASVKILAIRDVTGSMLIKEPVHAHRLGGFNDVPEMLLIVQLIEITPDGAALCAGQLHRIGQYLVTGLFSIELPCVVLPGAFQENVTLPKTVCPRGPGHPKQGLIHGLIAGGVPMDNAFVNKE